jgi:hypothetical protein
MYNNVLCTRPIAANDRLVNSMLEAHRDVTVAGVWVFIH